ncbi:DUF3570 domain-containing protein, partial [Methyloglobulus sp.]|uniref:DUF3570 domain-containing protein n=1 Tax=Methyloglobulus sp. TaxID=2518622 RepID=UPI0032B7B0DD
PGLFQPPAHAAEEDTIDFQYSHYQEGRREGVNRLLTHQITGIQSKYPVPNNRNPIEVDSLHGGARITLTDRIKFAFNYTEDTWSGATPIGSAPEQSGANRVNRRFGDDGSPILTGASPYASAGTFLDSKGNPAYFVSDPVTGEASLLRDRTVHVLSYASPETRKQGDFKLSYEWDEAALDIGGGISTERDYESRFVNLGGRMDFNQKQTTINLGGSYTNSAISAVLEPNGDDWFNSLAYKGQIDHNNTTDLNTLQGNREDWSSHLGLTQVLGKNALAELGMGYTRSTGFMENPYKLSWFFGVDPNDPNQQNLPPGIRFGRGSAFIEQRPDTRNQLNWKARLVRHVESLGAALHFDYQFAHDDWGINAHTFAADWVQPLGYGWTVTPRVRYYSQDAADFYKPFFVTSTTLNPDDGIYQFDLPENFSSDQRLSGYGALSGGVTVIKEFAKGIRLETGFEYYTHQGSLKLGSGGEKAFANFDYWVANAALKVNLSAVGQGGGAGDDHPASHHDHPNVPAGVLFGHTLDKAGDMMVGYRYMQNLQGGDLLHNTNAISEQQVIANGCPGTDGCILFPKEMTMSMHMLDLMVAPTDWLTLMLMPQFMDMGMSLYRPPSLPPPDHGGQAGHTHGAHGHETGGIGDTGLYAMVKLFDTPHHHLHISLGGSAPTGDVGIKLRDAGTKNLDGGFIHYGMQLGSGTWDFKPSLTYTGKANDLSWGVQVGGIKRLEDRNKSGYVLGDLFETSVWGGYSLTHWLSASVRAAYTRQGGIKGEYPRGHQYQTSGLYFCPIGDFTRADDLNEDGVDDGSPYFHQAEYDTCLANLAFEKDRLDGQDRPSPMDAPTNYGGQYVDIGFGLSATVPSGALAGNKLSFEWLQPVYTDVNGYQLDRDGALSFTWAYGF